MTKHRRPEVREVKPAPWQLVVSECFLFQPDLWIRDGVSFCCTGLPEESGCVRPSRKMQHIFPCVWNAERLNYSLISTNKKKMDSLLSLNLNFFLWSLTTERMEPETCCRILIRDSFSFLCRDHIHTYENHVFSPLFSSYQEYFLPNGSVWNDSTGCSSYSRSLGGAEIHKKQVLERHFIVWWAKEPNKWAEIDADLVGVNTGTWFTLFESRSPE